MLTVSPKNRRNLNTHSSGGRRRYTTRRAMQAAQEALHRNRLGWGYGAAHAILETSVRLGDMDTAKDCMGKLAKAGLPPKVCW